MRQKLTLVGLLATASLLLAQQGIAQTVVQYSGSLMIGFGDSDNSAQTNDAIPICAINSPNPFAKQTFGSLPVYGRAVQNGAGPGATLMFKGHGRPAAGQVPSLQGGAEIRVPSTCNVIVPPFLNPRLRSRIQAAGEIFPGTKGPWNGTFMTPVPAVAPDWTVGPGQGFNFTGMTLNTPIPFFAAGQGFHQIVKGANNFGGAIQYQGGGGVQLGINFAVTFMGAPLQTFGVVPYANGFLPTDPTVFGTDATGVDAPTTVTAFPNGLIAGQVQTMAARTPGGSTINQQGAIRTTMGVPMISPVNFIGAFHEWTTGVARHSDMVGDFVTDRTAMGFDIAPAPGTAPYGTTRRLQLVSPWAASIELVGPFGIGALVRPLGFGGLAVLQLDITPAPEPGAIAMLGLGVAGIAALGVRRRRKN